MLHDGDTVTGGDADLFYFYASLQNRSLGLHNEMDEPLFGPIDDIIVYGERPLVLESNDSACTSTNPNAAKSNSCDGEHDHTSRNKLQGHLALSSINETTQINYY